MAQAAEVHFHVETGCVDASLQWTSVSGDRVAEDGVAERTGKEILCHI